MTINIMASVLDSYVADIDPGSIERVAVALFLNDSGWPDDYWMKQLGPQQRHFWRTQAYLAVLIERNPDATIEHMTNMATAASDQWTYASTSPDKETP